MTPRQLDPDLVQQRLALMRRALDGLKRHRPVTSEQLQQDPDYAAAVERYVTQLVDLAVSVNAHLAAVQGAACPGAARSP